MALVVLGDRSYIPRPQCGFAVAFLQGQEHPPDIGVTEVDAATVITVVCPRDGSSEVSTRDFRNPPDA